MFASALGQGPSTPGELGLGPEDVWDFTNPRRTVLMMAPPEDGGEPWYTDAILVATDAEGEGQTFCLPASAAPEEPVTSLFLATDQNLPGQETAPCVYVYLAYDEYQEISDPVPVGVEYSMFAEPGQAPTMAEAVLKVPLAALPPEIAAGLRARAAGEAEEEELFAPDAAALADEPSDAPPAWPPLADPASLGLLLGGPGATPTAAGLPAPSSAPAVPPGVTGGFQPYGFTAPTVTMGGAGPTGAPSSLAPGPSQAPAPPAGRGRGTSAGGLAGAAPPAGRGRGRAAMKAPGASRPTMASLQALLTDGLARLQRGQDQLAVRLTAVESGAVMGAATPRPMSEAAFQTPREGPEALHGKAPQPGGTLLPQAPPLSAPPGLVRPPTLPSMGAPLCPPPRRHQPSGRAMPGTTSATGPAARAGGAAAAEANAGLAPTLPTPPAMPPPPQMRDNPGSSMPPGMSAVMKSLEIQSHALAQLVGSSGPLDLGGSGDGDATAGFRLGQPRGAAALQQWRAAVQSQPELITSRIRANRDQTLGGASGLPGPTATMRGYLTSEVPFGSAKTAAYLLFGIADLCDLMEHGRWHQAEAHAHLLLAAGEQAALANWQWPVAWLITQLPEPAWERIRHQPVPDTARPMSRLADQSLLAAVLAYYKDVSVVMEAQRKATGAAGPKAPGATTELSAAAKAAAAKRARNQRGAKDDPTAAGGQAGS